MNGVLTQPVATDVPPLAPVSSEVSEAMDRLGFRLPPALEASEPPEARGLRRDQVRLMVSHRATDRVIHGRFHDIARVLAAGDLLVVNTSGTMNAALEGTREDGASVELHLSTHLPGDLWLVEVRVPGGPATTLCEDVRAGEQFSLAHGGAVTIHAPFLGRSDGRGGSPATATPRLWLATVEVPTPLPEYLTSYGFPIRYGYVREPWPSEYYQTVFVTEAGSAEMPSAGRAFTPEVVTRLVSEGVSIAPLLLHTGVASPEWKEPPYDEFFRVPPPTARLVNLTHETGGRVIAVGTTVVRALETVTDDSGIAHPGEGWTSHVVTPDSGVRAVDGLLTGFHEPMSSHLLMLEAIAGRAHLVRTYAAALEHRYLWHEFGDLHLILP